MIVLALVAGLVLAVVFIILGRRGSAADKQPATQPEEPPEPAAKAKDDDKAKSGPSLKKLAKAAKARDTAPRTEDKLFFTALKGHTEGVLHAVFTPDGKVSETYFKSLNSRVLRRSGDHGRLLSRANDAQFLA